MARLKAVSQESRSAGLRWEQRAVGEALHGQSVAPRRGLFGGLITGGPWWHQQKTSHWSRSGRGSHSGSPGRAVLAAEDDSQALSKGTAKLLCPDPSTFEISWV